MSLDLEAARMQLWNCAAECSISDIQSFNCPDPVWLSDAETYVSHSCMLDCRERAFGPDVDTFSVVQKAAIDDGKQIVEISPKETSKAISIALITVVALITTIGICHLYNPRYA